MKVSLAKIRHTVRRLFTFSVRNCSTREWIESRMRDTCDGSERKFPPASLLSPSRENMGVIRKKGPSPIEIFVAFPSGRVSSTLAIGKKFELSRDKKKRHLLLCLCITTFSCRNTLYFRAPKRQGLTFIMAVTHFRKSELNPSVL